jgi:hypothetical protein
MRFGPCDVLVHEFMRQKHGGLHVVEGKAGRQDDDIGRAGNA